MVNTFLPWPDEQKTAKSLDNKRLGKQRVEGLQILRANLGLTKGWRNHPKCKLHGNHSNSGFRNTRIKEANTIFKN